MKPILDQIAAALDLSHDVKEVRAEDNRVVVQLVVDRSGTTRRVALQVLPE